MRCNGTDTKRLRSRISFQINRLVNLEVSLRNLFVVPQHRRAFFFEGLQFLFFWIHPLAYLYFYLLLFALPPRQVILDTWIGIFFCCWAVSKTHAFS